jgi:hypothetical protein
MRAQHVGKNLLIVSTYMLLLKDSLVLYPILNDGVIGLIGTQIWPPTPLSSFFSPSAAVFPQQIVVSR